MINQNNVSLHHTPCIKKCILSMGIEYYLNHKTCYEIRNKTKNLKCLAT